MMRVWLPTLCALLAVGWADAGVRGGLNAHWINEPEPFAAASGTGFKLRNSGNESFRPGSFRAFKSRDAANGAHPFKRSHASMVARQNGARNETAGCGAKRKTSCR